MNLEHSSEESNNHSSIDDEADQENDDKIVQDKYSVYPPSIILDIDSLSSVNNTSSQAIANKDATEEDLHTKNDTRNKCLNDLPCRVDAGTGVPSF